MLHPRTLIVAGALGVALSGCMDLDVTNPNVPDRERVLSRADEVETLAISRSCSRLMLVNRKSRESYRRGFYKKLGWEEREEFANFVLHLPRKRL